MNLKNKNANRTKLKILRKQGYKGQITMEYVLQH